MASDATFIDLLSDFGFKKIFGKENCSEEFLIDFLNELFREDHNFDEIVSIKYKSVEKSPNHIDDKAVRYDLFCETNTGHRFIVEMQKRNKSNFKDRVAYYMSREVVDQGIRANANASWDFDFVPVVGVFIANFFVKGLDRELVVPGKIINPHTGNVVIDKITYNFIQLEAFNKTAEECHTGFDKWIYMLKNMETLKEVPFKTYKDKIFERLGELSRTANLSEEERAQYDDYLKWSRDHHAELRYEREEGRAEGINEGLLISAKNMLRRGYDLGTVSEITGITIEKLKSLNH